MVSTRGKRAPKKKPIPKPAPAPEPEPDRSVQEMVAEAARVAALRRVASFLERTANQQWMRHRLGSFEMAVVGGLRNLLEEAERDEAENRSSESCSAHYTILYGLFTSLRHLFFWKAISSRIEDRTELQGRPPESKDLQEILQELEVFNRSAVSDPNQARFRRMLAESGEVADSLRKKILEQAQIYDTLNPLKDVPKA